MKSLLLREEEYIRMKKMGISEIARFLEESEYKTEIDKLAEEYQGIELLELSLNENLANTVNKILRICSKKELKELVTTYAKKWVINNIKIVLRGKINNIPYSEIKYVITPVLPTSYEFCYSLYQGDNLYIATNIERLTGVKKRTVYSFLEKKDMIGLENKLDIKYYSDLILFSQKLGLKDTHPLRKFFTSCIDLLNIKNALRFRKAGMKPEDIVSYLIPTENMKMIKKILNSKESEDIVNILKRLGYKELAKKEILKDLIEFRNEIDRWILKQGFRMLHTDILSASPVIGYLLCKETEIRNIKLLLHSKAMKVSEEFIDKNIIFKGG